MLLKLLKPWCMDLDREHHTVSWLDCKTISEGGKWIVKHLKSVASLRRASGVDAISVSDGSLVRIQFVRTT